MVDEDLEEKGIVRKVVVGEVDGVVYCDEYEGCMVRNGKVKELDELLGMMLKRTKCKKLNTACVTVTGEDHTLMLFNDVVMNFEVREWVMLNVLLCVWGCSSFMLIRGTLCTVCRSVDVKR